jgi:hypothetical protein
MYSNGMSEVVLGNAIKKLQLPREEIVVMTKVGRSLRLHTIPLFRSVGPPCGWQEGPCQTVGFIPCGARQSRLRQPARPIAQAHPGLCPGQPEAPPARLYRSSAMCVHV